MLGPPGYAGPFQGIPQVTAQAYLAGAGGPTVSAAAAAAHAAAALAAAPGQGAPHLAAALSDLHGAFGVLEGLVAGEGSGNTAAAAAALGDSLAENSGLSAGSFTFSELLGSPLREGSGTTATRLGHGTRLGQHGRSSAPLTRTLPPTSTGATAENSGLSAASCNTTVSQQVTGCHCHCCHHTPLTSLSAPPPQLANVLGASLGDSFPLDEEGGDELGALPGEDSL